MRSRLGYALAAASAVGGAVLGLVLGLFADTGVSNALVAFSAIGTVAVVSSVLWWRRPTQLVARRLLLVGLCAVGIDLVGRAGDALHPHGLALFALAVLGFSELTATALAALLVVLPDGRYRYRAARMAPRVLLVTSFVGLAARSVSTPSIRVPEPLSERTAASADNPLFVPALSFLREIPALTDAIVTAGLAVAAALLLARYVRGAAEERMRLRVIAAAVVFGIVLNVGVALALPAATPASTRALVSGVVAATTVLGLLAALVVSVLRYRLLDIEIAIRRSALYGTVWVALGFAYVGVATVLGVAATSRLPVAVATLVTVIATLLLQPVRARLDLFATRLLLGDRPTRYELLAQFGEAIEHAYEVDALAAEVAAAVRLGVDASWVRVLLVKQGEDGTQILVPQASDGITISATAQSDFDVPLRDGDATVGMIQCGARRSGSYGVAELELLATLGRQAALALRKARLAGELAARLDQIERQAIELSMSRARIVAAQDEERRRIERDIHDGAQQGIAALIAKLRLARNQLQRDPSIADATLEELQVDAGRTLEELREFAQGIHPSILTDRGLIAAVEARAARLPIGVHIRAGSRARQARFALEVEAAAFFVVAESLTNVVKHAQASAATVTIDVGADALLVRVSDDGVGFHSSVRSTSGLAGLRDRVEALGGNVRVVSQPGDGTTVKAEFPTRLRRESSTSVFAGG